MRENVKFIGIDAGNSSCKYAYFHDRLVGVSGFNNSGNVVFADGAVSSIHYGCIPNVTGQAIKLKLPPTGRDEDVLSVRVLSAENSDHRKPTFVGELAQQQLQEEADQNLDRNKVDSDSANIIIPSVLGLLDEGSPVVICVGATFQDYDDQAPRLQKMLSRKHEIYFEYGKNAGRTIHPNVVEVYTYPQTASGIIGMLRGDDGKLKRTGWAEKTIMGIDFGHGQIHVAIIQDMKFIQKACFSLDYGCFRIVSAVQDYLNSAPYYVTATVAQLQKAVEREIYLKQNNPIDLAEVTGSARAELMNLVYKEITARISKPLLDSVNEIVLMGGGADSMAAYVGSVMGMRPEIAENSMQANARGLLIEAKRKWEKEHAA